MKDEEIARALKLGTATVERVRRRGVEEGLEAALGRRQQLNRRQRKLDGAGEAHLIALVSCTGLGPRCKPEFPHGSGGSRVHQRELKIAAAGTAVTLHFSNHSAKAGRRKSCQPVIAFWKWSATPASLS